LTAKVVALQVKPGIQRDGTLFNAPTYVDGQWVRFQNGLPRKMAGYNGIFLNSPEVSRGMLMSSSNGINYVVSGTSSGLYQWRTDNDDGTGSGPYTYTLSSFTSNANNLWQFDIGYDSTGGGVSNLIAHPGQNLSAIDSTVNTRPMYGDFTGTTLAPVGVFTSSVITTNTLTALTLSVNNDMIGAGQSVTGTGIPANTTVVSSIADFPNLEAVAVTGIAGQCSCTITSGLFVGQTVTVGGTSTGTATGLVSGTTYYIIATNNATTFTLSLTSGGAAITTTAGTTDGLVFTLGTYQKITLSNAATATASAVTLTFDNNISVSGGVVMLHPYLFVYGNDGLIQNSSAGNFNNWVAADANANNVASGKVVKGLPLRGGTTSPAGLFWTLDSVVRVTYSPSTVGGISYYWKYDLITSQSSIMSSQCVIEYDGIFYWAGTDRFLMYNGVVQEVPNTQNMNWFFDGLSYTQRQKVWASKVPRWGEVWFFYPRGDATECTDAVIYNVREKTWYDAGQAPGARRSAGTFSEVFRQPIWAGNEENAEGTYTLWQHETGVNQVLGNQVNAIDSFFETPALGAYSGLVGASQQAGENLWTRCERVEPDFVQEEDMYLVVTGKGYADDVDQPSPPVYFAPDALKVDMREQRREMRMRFGSNTLGGNYFMGKVLLSLDTGDVRGTGNP
jgi:hypothetical protein